MRNRISSEIGNINDNCVSSYFTDGSCSAFQLLEYIIEQTGPANVYLTAFSLSESSVRSLFFMIEEKKINNLHCIFNTQIRRFKTDLSLFAQNFIQNIVFANVHAKLIIIENENWKIALIGSANFCENRRYEAGCIISIHNQVDELKTKFMELYNKSMNI